MNPSTLQSRGTVGIGCLRTGGGPQTPPRILLSLVGLLLLVGCTVSPPSPPGGLPAYYFPVPLDQTFDMTQGRVISSDELARELRDVRLVFLGEHHTDPRSHQFQLDVLRRLVAQGREITVALEMFPPSADPTLEAWRQGKLEELAFLQQSDWYGHWGFPWAFYRDLFLFFRVHSIPVYGVNAESSTREAVGGGNLDKLPPKLRADLGDLNEPLEPHRQYVLDALRATGHGAGMKEGDPTFRKFYRVQRMWDRLMGERSARLAEAQGTHGIVVLLIGSGHLAYGLGANLQAARVAPLPRLTVWDAVVDHDELDAQGRYPVPIGMADDVRIYLSQEHPVKYPSMVGVKLASVEKRVKVESVRLPDHAALSVLKPGDVIEALNGKSVQSEAGLRLAWEGLPFGKPAELTILRDGVRQTLTLEIKRSPHR